MQGFAKLLLRCCLGLIPGGHAVIDLGGYLCGRCVIDDGHFAGAKQEVRFLFDDWSPGPITNPFQMTDATARGFSFAFPINSDARIERTSDANIMDHSPSGSGFRQM